MKKDKLKENEEGNVTTTSNIVIKDKPFFKKPLKRKPIKTFKQFIKNEG